MSNSFLKNTFSVFFDKEIFTAVIAGLTIIGFISWTHIHKSIQQDVNHRLEYEIETVTSALVNSLNTYGFSLAYSRTFIDAHGENTDQLHFQAFAQDLQMQSTIYNLSKLNFVTRAELNNLMRTLPNSRKDDLIYALKSTSTTLIHSFDTRLTEATDINNFTMILALPYYLHKDIPTTEEERVNLAKGLVYIPVAFKNLFTNILGLPNSSKEHVNFTLSLLDPETRNETPVYTRFIAHEIDPALEKVHEFEMYGKRWKIAVLAMPDFLSFSDRYLGHIVALATALVIGLLLSLFKQFEDTIIHEAQAKSLLEESNKMKSAFLANMSHEIRTPLNAITGYSEILGRTENPKERQLLIENMQKNSSHLTGIIDNILDISNIEFGKIAIHTQHVSLRTLFTDVLLTMKNRACTKNLVFTISNDDLLPESIQTSESRVKQIMTNLLGNAIKFTEQGSIVISFRIEKSALQKMSLVVIVTDTGIGISKHDQVDLFQSFSQADVSSTRRFGGIGLGLVVSKRMAQQFGGDVNLIDSHLNRGSTFAFKIPCGDISGVPWVANLLTDVTQTRSSAQLQDSTQLSGKKILIVEDSEDNQEIFQFFLQSIGVITDLADNGIAAIHKVRAHNYDLILMDIQLPQMDGLEATRRLRIEGFKNPIIALTAHASPEEKRSSLESGCVGLITKPVSQNTLIQQILTIINDSTKDSPTRKVALTSKENYDRFYANTH